MRTAAQIRKSVLEVGNIHQSEVSHLIDAVAELAAQVAEINERQDRFIVIVQDGRIQAVRAEAVNWLESDFSGTLLQVRDAGFRVRVKQDVPAVIAALNGTGVAALDAVSN